jgi:thiol peroxidase
VSEATDDIPQRTGEAFELEEQLTIVGRKLEVGEGAPEFQLVCLDIEADAMRDVTLSESAGTVRILNVVNSLDTPVCHIETRRWEELRAADLPPTVRVYTVSMDLPFGQARWRTAHAVEHEALSAHANERFGTDYGVLLKEWRLLQREVFVIDRNGIITHAQYIADQMAEPDYDAAVLAAREAAA